MYTTTFYSYKGGVGRTLALVNVAAALAQSGRRVLIVDFDLEAPGIDTFPDLASRTPSQGLVDYVRAYLDSGQSPSVGDYIYEVGGLVQQPGSLCVMPAGRRDSHYQARWASIDWAQLYSEHEGYLMFEDLKAQWNATLQPDYVLIDSRTGHSDIQGICTRHLPNSVVFLFFPNAQNLCGLSDVVREVQAERRPAEPSDITVHFVISNVPDLDDEEEILSTSLSTFQRALGYKEPTAIIHHYPSLSLLNQVIFVKHRPNSRLSREYLHLRDAIVAANLSDPEGAASFLRGADRRHFRIGSAAVDFDAVNDRIDKIIETHEGNGEILALAAGIRRRQGRKDEAARLLDEALRAGNRRPEVLLARAESRQDLGLHEGVGGDILEVLKAPSVDVMAIQRAVRLLVEVQPGDVWRVPTTAAFGALSVFQQAALVADLMLDRTAVESVYGIIKQRLQGEVTDDDQKYVLVGSAMLCAISLQRYGEAMSVMCSRRPNASDLDIQCAFNYAIAEWGATGSLPLDMFTRVYELAKDSHQRSANCSQCIALACWAVEDREGLLSWLSAARAAASEYRGRVFSCWRYLSVPRDEFLADCDQIKALSEGARIVPMVLSQ